MKPLNLSSHKCNTFNFGKISTKNSLNKHLYCDDLCIYRQDKIAICQSVMFPKISWHYVCIAKEGIMRDTERVEDAIQMKDPPRIGAHASNIARRANRVLQVAQQEAENSEDPKYVDHVNQAASNLRASKELPSHCYH